jgi:general secretion pathway protein D
MGDIMASHTHLQKLRRWIALSAAVLLLSACAAQRLQREGLELIEAGSYEDGVARLEAATKEEPRDPTYRISLANSRDRIALRLIDSADRAHALGNAQEAEAAYRRLLGIDAKNQRAIDGLRATEQQKNIETFVASGHAALQEHDLETAQRAVDSALLLNPKHPGAKALRKRVDEAKLREAAAAGGTPQLKSKFAKPVSLEFRDANLKMVFEVLSKTSGINFIFDKEVKADLKATIFVRQVAVEDVIDILLVQSQLEKKVINENSILIYPNTTQKLKEFQDLTVKSFYLTNADAKQTLNMIKAIVKTKDVFIDEKLNLLIMRDTPDAIRLAEKLIASQDLAEPEVVLEIEVLELNRNKLLDVGIQWPSQIASPVPEQLRGGTGVGDVPPVFDKLPNNVSNFKKSLNINNVGNFIVDRGLVLKLASTDSDSRQLASPRIRVRSKEKAKIHIGDKVPVVTATIAATTGTTPITTDTIQYLDVGIKLEVEPTVYLNEEVAIKLSLDVSSATQLTPTKNGSIPVQVSTRNASTLLRLKDGETQALAGLIQDSHALSRDKIPGLGDIPILGHLFGTNRNDDRNTELVLLVTPRIVRNLQRADVGLAESFSGTESSIRSRPYFTRPIEEAAPVKTSARVNAPAAAPTATPEPVKNGKDAAPLGVATVSWEGPAELTAGEEGIALLRIKSEQPLSSTALQIGFDPTAIKVVEVAEGDFLNRDGASTSFSTRIDEKAGRLFVGASRPGTAGMSGEGTLVRLKFSALAGGDKTPLKLIVFSAVGPGNRLVQSALPEPLEVAIAP